MGPGSGFSTGPLDQACGISPFHTLDPVCDLAFQCAVRTRSARGQQMKSNFRCWAVVRAAAAHLRLVTQAEDEWVVGADGTRVRSRLRWGGGRAYFLDPGDPGHEEMLREFEVSNRPASDAPTGSPVMAQRAAVESAKGPALLSDLVENDVTYKSFEDFKAWRTELASS